MGNNSKEEVPYGVSDEPSLVSVSITVDGIDFFEQSRLQGKGNGWSYVTEHVDE
ncbi:hypothetical protein MHI12_03035 [Paenibacillus sp. FSL H8-0280]|uniref:hypothetical protein n=1 Tax=Paenibacillus sp. FSL H8-0280 TaxID=2921382 RepID=UPI00324B85B8